MGFHPSSSDRAYSVEYHEVHHLGRFKQVVTEPTSRQARTGSGYSEIGFGEFASLLMLGWSSRMSMDNDGSGNNSFEICFFFLLESCSHIYIYIYLAENERTNKDQPINIFSGLNIGVE